MLGSARKEEVFLIPFIIYSNAAQPQPFGRFERILYQKLQFSVLLYTLKPGFENVAPHFKIVHSVQIFLCYTLLENRVWLGAVVEA